MEKNNMGKRKMLYFVTVKKEKLQITNVYFICMGGGCAQRMLIQYNI